jgi:hypothetical protein
MEWTKPGHRKSIEIARAGGSRTGRIATGLVSY